MKIQLKSDLHEEFARKYSVGIRESYENPWQVHPEADVLVLAGDIVCADSVDDLLEMVENVKIPILYVPGNHEYYGTSMEEGEVILSLALKGSNVTLLNPGWDVIGGVFFVGATLWTSLHQPIAKHLASRWSDFDWIKDNTVYKWQQRHVNELNYISDKLKHEQFKDMPKVVITHHLPSEKSTPEQFKGDMYNCFFNTNCEDIMNEPWAPKLWLHGHTHDSFDYVVGNTRVVCNPYGYFPRSLNKAFNRDLLLEVK